MWAGVGGRRIINLFTQEPAASEGSHPGHATLGNVNHCLRELHKLIATEQLTSVALPRLATGIGHLQWGDVRPLIHTHLGALTIPVFIYSTFKKGVKAVEPKA